MHSTFADGIVHLAITGALIRIDYGVATPVPASDGQQELRMTPTQQVVMPLEGFVRAFALQEKLFQKLVAEGVIQLKAPPPSDVIKPSVQTL